MLKYKQLFVYALQWGYIMMNLPGTKEYKPYMAWVMKRRADGLLAKPLRTLSLVLARLTMISMCQPKSSFGSMNSPRNLSGLDFSGLMVSSLTLNEIASGPSLELMVPFWWNTMHLALPCCSRHFEDHSIILLMASCSSSKRNFLNGPFSLGTCANIAVSSANSEPLMELGIPSKESLLKIINSNGLSTPPCGTPEVVEHSFDKCPSTDAL